MKFIFLVFLALVGSFAVSGFVVGDAPAQPNYDESKVPEYTLPDPLLSDGGKVDTPEKWNEKRRPELLALFEEHVYGKPVLKKTGNPFKIDVELFDSASVFDGKGMRYQFRISFFQGEKPNENDPAVDFLIYRPAFEKNSDKTCPMFLGYNFRGNHTVNVDPGIRLGKLWQRKTVPVDAKEEERGSQASRWPVETILARGFAVGTAYYESVEPDAAAGMRYGVRRFLYQDGEKQKPDEANTIATWAWALGLMLDIVTENKETLRIDPKKVAVIGHSRLGKTSLWAGAIDPRFAIVISNNSGCGGAALSRREFGETVQRINRVFPHWFCDDFKNYDRNVNALPVDQHELVALIAPRPVYVASATEDRWADPKGEFLAALHADPVYRLLGTDGFGGVTEMPEPGPSVGGTIGYHLRPGKHDIQESDWIRFMDFAEKHY